MYYVCVALWFLLTACISALVLCQGTGVLGWQASWCDLSERSLGIGGSVGLGVFMAGGALAGHHRICSGIWNVCHLGGCF